MIVLYEKDIYKMERNSSKGNQLKFKRDNIWYKADYLGYEGLVEYAVSKLLKYSTLDKNEYVDYELEQFTYNESILNGCISLDFTKNYNLITLERLFKNTYGYGLNKIIYSTPDHIDRLRILVEQVERTTGIKNFGVYMNKMLTIDALFLNEDRHTHNIAVLTNNIGDFKLAPIFDNGAGLMSDTRLEYPLSGDVIKMIDRVKSKTISDSFEEQMSISEQLYGYNIHFNFGYNEVKNIADKAEIYDRDIRSRVIEIIMQMRRRYEYLFS